MKTAIDTSVLLAMFNDEPDGERWLDRLIEARRIGQLVICDVVYAEIAPAFESQSDLDATLRKLGALFDPIEPESAWEAGVSFRAYRASGGPRDRLIADFLIAAHARVQADQLAAIDRGYLRRYFSELPLLSL